MNTLAEWMKWIEARVVKEDDCLVWQQALNGNQPQACIGGRDTKRVVNIRRELWALKNGRAPRRSYVIVCTCDTYACVEPTHLKEISRSQMLKGKPLTVTHKAAITKAARRRSKLKQEDVDDIRYGEGTPAEKAQRYGITVEYVGDIMAQRSWRDLHTPFAGLGARIVARDDPERKPVLRRGEFAQLAQAMGQA